MVGRRWQGDYKGNFVTYTSYTMPHSPCVRVDVIWQKMIRRLLGQPSHLYKLHDASLPFVRAWLSSSPF